MFELIWLSASHHGRQGIDTLQDPYDTLIARQPLLTIHCYLPGVNGRLLETMDMRCQLSCDAGLRTKTGDRQ